jgi:Tfp pilus assembly protein PilF
MSSSISQRLKRPGRRAGLLLVICIGICVAFLSAIHAAVDPQAKEAEVRKVYADKISLTYSYPFPTSPDYANADATKISSPGNAAIQGNTFIEPGAFPTAEYCEHCHQEAYHEWRQSLHSNAFRTPFYRTSVNILMRTKGIEFARHCDSCHNPIGVLSGALNPAAQGDRSFDRNGLTCMVCHSIQKIGSLTGNGSFVLGVPAVMVDEDGNRIPGEVPDAEILAHPDRHAMAVMQDIMRTPEFCAMCHKANLPPQLNDYKWIRAFTTFDEWQNSKFSQRNPLTFYPGPHLTCQGCHMKNAAITLPDYGAVNGMLASHRWAAGNTAVPFYYGFTEQLDKTIAFLKSGDYLNVDIFGLKLNGKDQLVAPLGSVPFSVRAGDTVETWVVIQNKNIGHSLLPEVRDLYEPWVSFTVKDASGAEIYKSGFLKSDGSLDSEAHSFTNRPVDATGSFVDNHKVFTIHSVAYDNTIQAGRSTLVRYKFRLPEKVTGPVTITASVEYRHLRQSYLNNVLGKDHPAYPVIELASRTRTLNIGSNAPTDPLSTDNPDWMRWNNLGISLMDQLQYVDAMQAFERVVRLRPDYKDGYINIGINDLEWEKYADARAPIAKALALQPHDARALYYLALVDKREGHASAEVAELKDVVGQYPDSRDARRELGIAYYQEHDPVDAIEQFVALQAIDPDDLAAHYNLAILYRRVGLKKQAAEQAAQYAIKRVDPAAPTYSLDFLRNHPEISNESAPWHIHTNLARVHGTEAGAP